MRVTDAGWNLLFLNLNTQFVVSKLHKMALMLLDLFQVLLITSLLCIDISLGFNLVSNGRYLTSPQQARKAYLDMTAVVLFGPDSGFRVHDNPCLRYASEIGEDVIPIYVNNPSFKPETTNTVINSLSTKIQQMGGDLLCLNTNGHQTLGELISSACKSSQNVSVLYCKSSLYNGLSPSTYTLWESIGLDSLNNCGINTIGFTDQLVDSDIINVPKSAELQFSKFANILYSKLESRVDKPLMSIPVKFAPLSDDLKAEAESASNTLKTRVGVSAPTTLEEEIGINIVKDYAQLGEIEFSRQYANLYVELSSTSDEHKVSLERLLSPAPASTPKSSTKDHKFFQGEVLSGVLSPLLELGMVSPRLLVHARSALFPGTKSWSLPRPLVCRLQNEAVSKASTHPSCTLPKRMRI